jgi:hemolysin III
MRRTLPHFGAETINSITHALGILFGIISIPSLIAFAAQHGSTGQVIGVSIYGSCYIITFTFSTLFHAFKQSAIKQRFELLDHISIYFLIAATYTPFVLHYMNNQQGILLLTIVWSLVITGIFFKLYYLHRFIILSIASYVSMSLMFLVVRRSFFEDMPAEVINLLYTGIVLYLLGIIFFLWQKLKHHHAVWHLFVLAASICHYQAIWLSVTA